MARHTIADVAEKLSVSVDVARGLVRFLVEVGFAERVGQRQPPMGRGAPADVYSFGEGYEKALARLLKRAALT
jgi:predicted ArsR family transcriptional regulator